MTPATTIKMIKSIRYAPTLIQNPACLSPAGWGVFIAAATGCWKICADWIDAPQFSQNLPSGVFFPQFGQMTIVHTTFDLSQANSQGLMNLWI